MGDLTIRGLGEALQARLQSLAAAHGRTLEDEARLILAAALGPERVEPDNLADAIMAIFQPLDGVDLPIPSRDPIRDPPDFR